MLSSPEIHAVCILVKDYYDIEAIEKIKSVVAKMPYFRFFISPQYRKEPKYDVYIVTNDPEKMIESIEQTDLTEYIDIIAVNKV